MQEQRYAVIVEPVSTGHEYADAFRAEGLEPVAVMMAEHAVEAVHDTWHPENFVAVHVLGDRTPEQMAGELRQYRPQWLVAGSEMGVELCDALAAILCPGTGNDPASTLGRRDKWHMAQALARAGLPHLRQFCSADRDEIERWITEQGLAGERFVVKPPKSGATDDVHLILPGEDWHPVFDRIIGKINHTGVRNDAVLVQEFGEGTEYLVDTYSVDGRHGLVDVCRYAKHRRDDRIGIYERVQFLAPDDPDVAEVAPYVFDVLDALGVRNGPGHSEVMLTKHGPRLMETAARPAGGGHQMITRMSTGDSQIARTVAHRLRGEFKPGYELRRHLSAVFISSPAAGIWRNGDIFDGVDALPTFVDKHFPLGTGDLVPATDDLVTYLAWVILAGPDPDAIEADYQRIKAIESRIEIERVDA
ncbi:ATP-grasp domain-containing protein [Dactylosporangium sp. CA-139114]|uniref:ATP-grasp domain-containing protein n=1 Tax=Dactylosporangium sp. CA-139114 TaxID=3239931 RepID=UPI003D982E15